MKISSILSGVQPFLAMDVLKQARELGKAGRSVLHLEIGQTSMPPPERVRHALQARLDTGEPGYTEALGIPELRQKIANFYGLRYDLDVDPERVVVTNGSSGALLLGFLMAFERGAKIALPLPW